MTEVPTEGGVRLFRPTAASTIAAIFAHGVDSGDEIDPVAGVMLGYYSTHGNALDANITWAASAPTHPPQKSADDPQGKWVSYVLTSIGVSNPEELADTANEYGMAIAYVVDATSTAPVVSDLARKGYTDIRGVHCRESLSTTEAASFGAAREITHDALVSEGWTDDMTNTITAETELAEGDAIAKDNVWYKVSSVVEAKSRYMIEAMT